MGNVSLKSGAGNVTTLELHGNFAGVRADSKGPLEVETFPGTVVTDDARFRAGGADPSSLKIDASGLTPLKPAPREPLAEKLHYNAW